MNIADYQFRIEHDAIPEFEYNWERLIYEARIEAEELRDEYWKRLADILDFESRGDIPPIQRHLAYRSIHNNKPII